MNLRWLLGATLLIGLGCANRSVSSAGDTGTTGSPESSGTEEQGTTGAATIEPDSSTGTTDETGTTSFGCVPDLDPPGECDLWCPACPRAHKCMPWGEENRRARNATWEATHCSPLAPDVNAPNERCEVDAHLTSGHDDCDVGSMCWHVDRVTLEGICVALCRGSQSEPSCDGPCDYCAAATGMPLCLSQCNPVLQDCLPGYGCYPVDDTFSCLKHAGGPADTCAYINACSPGWFCAPARSVNGCESRTGCCAPFCDLTAREPCASSDARTECIPSYDDDVAPEDGCLDHGRIGGCLLSD